MKKKSKKAIHEIPAAKKKKAALVCTVCARGSRIRRGVKCCPADILTPEKANWNI